MLKTAIAPIQAWLLSRGQCVGCGTPLKKGKFVASKNGSSKVTCKCGRIFIHDKKNNTFRRALFSEI